MIIIVRYNDTQRKERYKKLGLTPQEEAELLAYDKAVERGEATEYDATPEQIKVQREMTRTGTRKAPTAYKFGKKERKPNATKGQLIEELYKFLESGSEFSIVNLNIANKERQIAFSIGDDDFELTLVQKRKKK